jgi:serine/threonine protein kinase
MSIINIDDEYEVLSQLGKGSFGVVYKVQQKADTHKIYALKLMNPQKVLMSNVRHEFNILKKLGKKCNQGLVCYHKLFTGVYKNKEYICLLMDYVEGSMELYEYIEDNCEEKYLSSKEIKEFMTHLVTTLKLLHDHNIVHRDIKTNNILYSEDKIILIDYGMSCYLLGSGEKETCDGMAGTQLYLSPELWEYNNHPNKNKLTDEKLKASDVWALGMVFYELINCKLPYDENVDDIYETLKTGNFDSCIKPNKKIADIVNSMLTIDYKERPSIDHIYEILTD